MNQQINNLYVNHQITEDSNIIRITAVIEAGGGGEGGDSKNNNS